MKILIVGGGGREHAIAWKLAQSPKVEKLYCAPGNAGIAEVAECVNIGVMEFDKLVEFAKEHEIDMTVVAPDDPLAAGAVDAFEAAGLRAFGPRANAAILEGSKAFSCLLYTSQALRVLRNLLAPELEQGHVEKMCIRDRFEAMGLKPVIYRAPVWLVTKTPGRRIGYHASSPNSQFDYDHRYDQAIFFDKAFKERKLAVLRTAYEMYKKEASWYAGPAVVETFGEEGFQPVNKEAAYGLSEKQQELTIAYSNESMPLSLIHI